MSATIFDLRALPPGFGFHPKDEVLVNYYLKHKLLGNDDLVSHITQVDICNFEPWQLPALSGIKSNDQPWFFFNARHYKYTNSIRSCRKTKCGFWKSTGNDREIKAEGSSRVIGFKKTLVFYKGKFPRGERTNWIMHEYRAHDASSTQTAIVLCSLKKNPEKRLGDSVDILANNEEPHSSHAVPVPENQETEEMMQEHYTTRDEILATVFQSYSPRQNDLSSLLSTSSPHQERFFPDISFDNVQFPSDANEMQNDIVDELLNSDFDHDLCCIERTHTLVNDPTPPASLLKYQEPRQIMSLTSIPDEYRRYIDPVSDSDDSDLNEGIDDSELDDSIDDSDLDEGTEKENAINHDGYAVVETSSRDSSALKDYFSHFQGQAREDFDLLRGATQEELSQIASLLILNMNERLNSDVDSHKLKTDSLGGKSSGTSYVKPMLSQSSVNSWKVSSLVYLEAPLSSQKPCSQTMYLVNTIIGLLLLVAVSWFFLSCATCL